MATATPLYCLPAETTTIRDLDVAYRRKGSGAPLLYLHGAELTRRWLPLYDRLAETFDVLVPNHPGFGETARPAWLKDFSDLVLHYRDLLDAFRFERVHLVGHALGGWIAAEFAGVYPERVASLTLIAPTGLRPVPADGEIVDGFRLEPEQRLSVLLGDDAPRWADAFADDDPVESAVRDYNESITEAVLAWNPRYSIKLERRLARVTAPAQVLLPQRDLLVPASTGPKYADLLPGARLVTVDGQAAQTGHLLVLQEPKQVAALIAELADRGASR